MHAWYYGTSEPQSLTIGPAGHNCAEWRELESVATPPERQGNPFYMEGEAACVMNRHNLTRVVEKTAKRGCIHYSRINYAVPGVTIEPRLFTPEYFLAQKTLREQFLAKSKL
jgi:hypothetical protein